jgi:hypothetical protein
MLSSESVKSLHFCDGLTRRDFLRVGGLSAGAVGLSLANLEALGASRPPELNCILLFLVGGPSHLDTWDLKPDAPQEIRGPFKPIATNVPGLRISEHFPRMARMADQYAIVRSVHHTAAPIHETGHQLMQTGRLFRGGEEYPHYGSVISYLRGPRPAAPTPFVVLPGLIGSTGVSVSHGQSAGPLGSEHEPFVVRGDPASADFRPVFPAHLDASGIGNDGFGKSQDAYQATHRAEIEDLRRRVGNGAGRFDLPPRFTPRAKRVFNLAAEPDRLRDRYGRSTFGQSCLLARRLVENGVRFVAVNMFDTVFNNVTWDCHADGGSLATNLYDYKDTLCPMFDRAYTTLLDDLRQRGLLDTTLVLAMGEFGRTPRLNPRGGRDHWPGCWSVLFAGAGVRGGQVVGASDATGAEPKERPVTPAEIAATVYKGLGLNPRGELRKPDGDSIPLTDAAPVSELFR